MGAEPFRRQWTTSFAWRSSNWHGHCPFLPALAMTVLAVTEDPLGASHGVYRRLNSLLGLPTEAQQPPGYQDHVPAMWAAWNEWLDGPGGLYGRPSARTHPHWPYQGWARSQGLIRYRDRLQIENFIGGVRLPFSENPADAGISAPGLVDQFRGWLRYRGHDGERLLDLMGEEAACEIVTDVLADEIARWARLGSRDRLPTEGCLHALYFYDAWEGELRAVLPVGDRLRKDVVTVGGEEVALSDFDTHLTLPLPGSASQLLDRGAAWSLRPGVPARISPAPVIVFCDDPLLGGLVQVRGRVAATSYTLLCRDDLLGAVSEALAAQAPLQIEAAGHQLRGWSWLRGVTPESDSQLLRALGIGSLARPAPVPKAVLSGGLRLTGGVYLTGGEPDISAPAMSGLTLDGDLLVDRAPELAGTSHAVLADLVLDPGSHVVIDSDGISLTFETVTHVRETALGSSYLQDPLESLLPATGTLPSQTTSGVAAARPPVRMSGALVVSQGQSLTEIPPGRLALLRSRVLPGRHALVLREDGSLVEVYPTPETWLGEIALSPTTVDVLRAVRTMAPRPAYFLEFAPRLRSCTAVEIPEGTGLLPGRVDQREADELLGTIIAGTWVTGGPEPSRDRRQTILSRSFARGAGSGPLLAAAHPAGSTSVMSSSLSNAPIVRRDVTCEAPEGNPYDDVLTWLSERESASASIADFALTWAWACRRHGLTSSADRYGVALARLGDLGFIESDWPRRRVHAAASTAVEIPAANGLLLLTGARPLRLLERLEDDEDANPAVARASQLWMVHHRNQLEPSGEPAAPTVIYLEIDTSQVPDVAAGLQALGIRVAADPSHQILSALPNQSQLSRVGLNLDVSPGREIQRLRSETSGITSWTATSSDRARGLYRYLLARGDRYAWRASPDSSLLAVTRAAGLWLEDAEEDQGQGHRRRLVYLPGTRTLMVTKRLSLPWAVRRALALRTGLLPTLSEAQGHQMPHPGTHLTYRNVDAATADTVGRILGREPVF